RVCRVADWSFGPGGRRRLSPPSLYSRLMGHPSEWFNDWTGDGRKSSRCFWLDSSGGEQLERQAHGGFDRWPLMPAELDAMRQRRTNAVPERGIEFDRA